MSLHRQIALMMHPAAGGQPVVIFDAVAPDPDTFVMTDVITGTPPITDARVADIELPDYQGIYQTFGQELAYEGGRVTGDEGSRVVYADDGIDPLVEVPWLVHAPQATNYFLNSHAPASQTVSGRTGSHTVWIDGSGSVAVTGGIMDTVTDGSPLTGDPGGSDVILTVTGVPDFVQFENNAFPTFPIETTGAAVTRDACDLEIPSINHSDQGDKYTLEVVVTGGPCNVLGTFLQYDGANFVLTDGTNSQSVAAAIGEHSIEILYSSAGGEMSLSVDGSAHTPVAYNGILLRSAFKLFLDSPFVGKARNIKRYGFPVVTLLEDNFTDADGTLLTDHIPDFGPVWETVGANLVSDIDQNRASAVNYPTTNYNFSNVDTRNVVLTASIKARDSNDQIRLYVRQEGVVASGPLMLVRSSGALADNYIIVTGVGEIPFDEVDADRGGDVRFVICEDSIYFEFTVTTDVENGKVYSGSSTIDSSAYPGRGVAIGFSGGYTGGTIDNLKVTTA